MKTWRTLAALATFPLGVACGGGGGNDLTGNDKDVNGPNRSPSIQSIVLSPDPVPWGGTAVVTVRASDPDDHRLTYAYAAGQGAITQDPADPARATYTHNGRGRPDRVTVTVTDERSASHTLSADIPIAEPIVAEAPSVTVSVSPDACHPRCTVTFTASARRADVVSWSGCASGSGDSVKCAVDGLDSVSATCTVKNGAGEASDSATARGVNERPSVSGGTALKGPEAELPGDYSDPDGDVVTCNWWGPGDRSACQKLAGCEDFSGRGGALPGCKAGIPSSAAGRCTASIQCRDPFGATSSTTWTIEN